MPRMTVGELLDMLEDTDYETPLMIWVEGGPEGMDPWAAEAEIVDHRGTKGQAWLLLGVVGA